MRRSREFGFTLVETVVVVAIITVLAGLSFSGVQLALRKGAEAREVSAARKLIGAYMVAISENDGVLPPGYDRTATDVHQRDGRLVSGPAAHRYPWRMMPYLGGAVTDSLFVSRNRSQVDPNDEYLVSLYPSFGMNYIFVGGDMKDDGSVTFLQDCVRRMSQVGSASKLLVFASSRAGGSGDQAIEGYSILTPPNLTGAMWQGGTKYDKNSSPERYGHLDLRYNGRGVCAFLDGHVTLLGVEELGDMRYWSSRAAELDDPSYTVTAPSSGGGRR